MSSNFIVIVTDGVALWKSERDRYLWLMNCVKILEISELLDWQDKKVNMQWDKEILV